MTVEIQLINKEYYKKYTGAHENNPVRVLGEALIAAQNNGAEDVGDIRFAQGEVYFQNMDFEAAVYKWENINNELEPWARKNIADSYYELGQLSTAEEIYKSISSENSTLESEVALQLFSLYIEQGKLDLADGVIKNAVSLHPDYPNLTNIARAFFEKHKDWSSAIELAVNEAVRTESTVWFDVLKTYTDQGLTQNIAPNYFSLSLYTLHGVDRIRFEQLAASLWKGYRNESFFSWQKEFDSLFLALEADREDGWNELPALYQETYFELINGKHLIRELEDIMPGLLANWIKITDSSHALFASAAVLAWSEIFPSTISPETVNDAENLIFHARNNTDALEYSLALFESIIKWAEQQEAEVGPRFKWIIRELIDFQTHYMLIAGTKGNGKSAFINLLLGESLLGTVPSSSVVMFKGSGHTEISKISDLEITPISGFQEFQETLSRRRRAGDTVIDFRIASPFLQENRLALIDTPGINGGDHAGKEVLEYLHLADSLLFVLNANNPLTEEEQALLMEVREQAPNLSAHFLLNKMDEVNDEQEATRIVDETWSEIGGHFPKAKLFAFSSKLDGKEQLSELEEFLKSNFSHERIEEDRIEKLLIFIRKTIVHLLDKRVEIENALVDSIKWNEEMGAKLNGTIHQLKDLENEKTKAITKTYRKAKEEIRIDLLENIPKILRDSSDFIKEDSDFRKIHLELNDEMNRRIQEYINDKILPRFYLSLQKWVENANEELNYCQSFLREMGEGFNAMYDEERLQLDCDFKILDDWRRDADRMTSRMQLDKVNIFLRRTPSQFLLKSAGKLFGALPQNNAMLYNKYKQFIENEDYHEAAQSIITKFLIQFDLFEKSLERDISIFFRNPYAVLNHAVEETRREIQEREAELKKMRTNPETYRDPLTLFEVKLRQYEWISIAGKGVPQI